MRLNEAIEILNSKKMTVQALAKEFGVSKDLLADVLKDHGYEFNNKTKLREYVGEGTPVDIELDSVVEERKSAKSTRKRKQTSDNNQKKIREKSDLNLSEDEIKFVKNLAKGRTEWQRNFELNYEFSQLPLKHQTKKASYEINLTVYDDFEKFAESFGKPRNLSRNALVELALHKFMRDFQ